MCRRQIPGTHADDRNARIVPLEPMRNRVRRWSRQISAVMQARRCLKPRGRHRCPDLRLRCGRPLSLKEQDAGAGGRCATSCESNAIQSPKIQRACQTVKKTRYLFLAFATSTAAVWQANFRDLNGAVTRMATLAPRGRIAAVEVREETVRLSADWRSHDHPLDRRRPLLAGILSEERRAGIDPFDQAQLDEVLRGCRDSKNLSEAGRRLFAASRQAKKKPNDADRLRKYLGRCGLAWSDIAALG
jgi:hypothetical protein